MGDDRMIRSGLINMIRENARKGKSAYAVGKELGISKNTAKKYMHQPKTEHGLKGRTRPIKPGTVNNVTQGQKYLRNSNRKASQVGTIL
jgi:transposase